MTLLFQEKGEWNGLVRSLMDGKADMSMASLSITEERNEQIDFSVPFLETGITIIVAVRDGVISPTAFLGKLSKVFSCFRKNNMKISQEQSLNNYYSQQS